MKSEMCYTMPLSERLWQVFFKVNEFVLNHAPEVIGALLCVGLTWIMGRVTRTAIHVAMARTDAGPNIRSLVSQSGYIGVWVLGLAISLSLLNVNLAGVLAALGITGAALGLGLRDVISNMVCGIILLSVQPFSLGDTVVIEGNEGTVEDIKIRVTTLRTGDGKQIQIPNSRVFAANITNLSAYTQRRPSFLIKVAGFYQPDAVRKILLESVKTVPGVLPEPAASVQLTDMSGEALTFEIAFSVDTTRASLGDVQRTVRETARARLLANHIRLV